MLQEDITTWSKSVEDLYKEVSSFIKNNPLPTTKSFEDIQKRKILYESYSIVIEISNKVAEFLDKIVSMQMIKNQFKRLIRIEYRQSMLTTLNTFVDEVAERVNIIDKEISNYKYGLDNQLRFYQSIQYILGSPRLSSLD